MSGFGQLLCFVEPFLVLCVGDANVGEMFLGVLGHDDLARQSPCECMTTIRLTEISNTLRSTNHVKVLASTIFLLYTFLLKTT